MNKKMELVRFEPTVSIPEDSRQKTLWLQDAVVQRRYNECNREPSAYLSNKENITQFPFMERQINREALRITRMGDRKSTSKSGYGQENSFNRLGTNLTQFNKV